MGTGTGTLVVWGQALARLWGQALGALQDFTETGASVMIELYDDRMARLWGQALGARQSGQRLRYGGRFFTEGVANFLAVT